MKVSFPNMGNSWPAFKTFFECMGASVNHALRLVERNRPFTLPKRKSEGDIRFLLLGHDYNIFDTFINLDFQKKLKDQGVEVITIENLPESIFKKPVIVNPRGAKLLETRRRNYAGYSIFPYERTRRNRWRNFPN